MKKMKIVNKSTTREIKAGWFSIVATKASAADEIYSNASLHIFGELGWEVTAREFCYQLEALGPVESIEVEVGSIGGNIVDGLQIYNALILTKAKISMLVTSLAASMASVIVQAAAPGELRMLESSLQMLHNPSTGVQGDQHDHAKTAEALAKVRVAMIAAYMRRFNGTEEELIALLDKETWMTAEDCIANGLADEIIDTEYEMAACLTEDQIVAAFKNPPEELLAMIKGLTADDDDEDIAAIVARSQKVQKILATQKTPAAAGKKPREEREMTPEEIAAAAKAARVVEAKRQSDIRAAFLPHNIEGGMNDLMTASLDDLDCTIDMVNAQILAKLGESNKPAGGAVVTVEDARDKYRAGIGEAIQMKMGVKPIDHNNEFVSTSLFEMCKKGMDIRGQSYAGMDRQKIVAVALQPGSDFPGILENIVTKEVLRGYSELPEVYTQLARIGSLPDFKTASRTGLGAAPSMTKNGELQEVETIEIADRAQSIQLSTFAARLGLSRQAIINDDLNEFSRMTAKVGQSARRTVGDQFAEVFTANALGQMLDEGAKRIFHADRNNTGTGGAPTTASFTELRTLMKMQSDVGGNAKNLNINPRFIFCPVALEGVAQVVAQSEREVAGSKNLTTPNVERGRWEIVCDSRLDAASTTRYYGLADPNMYDTIEVAFLDGRDEPQIQQVDMYDPLGVYWVGWIDTVAQALDFRGMAINAGV